jgi:hypothetical protein
VRRPVPTAVGSAKSNSNSQAPLNQPPDRFGAGRLGVGLAFDPGGDRRLQLRRHAQAAHGMDARPGAAARSFLFNGY